MCKVLLLLCNAFCGNRWNHSYTMTPQEYQEDDEDSKEDAYKFSLVSYNILQSR